MFMRKVRRWWSRAAVGGIWQPSGERRPLSLREVLYPAVRLASSTASDDDARAQLRPLVQAHPEMASRVVEHLRKYRDAYVTDRAYRLVCAAIEDTPVQPVDADQREYFERERELLQLPNREAFARLARLVPELGEFVRQAASPGGGDALANPFSRLSRRLDTAVGPLSHHPDPLVRSWLAVNVVFTHLDEVSGRPPRGETLTTKDGITVVTGSHSFRLPQRSPREDE
jgi:hypothetical protein